MPYGEVHHHRTRGFAQCSHKESPYRVLALWLKHHRRCQSKEAHHDLKANLRNAAFREDRKRARQKLWDIRHTLPGIIRIFSLEAKVPDEILLQENIEQELWEPLQVLQSAFCSFLKSAMETNDNRVGYARAD